MGKDETIPKQMTSQANSVLNKFKAAENGGGLLHVATKPLNQSVSPSLLKRQQSGDEIRKAFEKELMAGKQKLKKLGNDSKTSNNGMKFHKICRINDLLNQNRKTVLEIFGVHLYLSFE